MSLGRLLTAGKSLVGLHSPSRYQLRTGTLPKFGSTKNPFAKQPADPAEQDLDPAEMAAPHLKKTQRLPLLTPRPGAGGERFQPAQPGEGASLPPEGGTPSSPPQPAVPAHAPVTVNRWLKKLNPLVWFGDRHPVEAKPAVPRSRKAPVQGELSLENIKVMRNDLSDADVEIVPAKAFPAAQASAAAMAIPELPPATSAWEFLGERLLRNH